jgi:hypothetical protein
MFIYGDSGKAFTKNMQFSRRSTFGWFAASQNILIGWVNVAGMNPQFGLIKTGIGADVYTKKAIGHPLHGFEMLNWVIRVPSKLLKTNSSSGFTSIKWEPTSIALIKVCSFA